jgi:hypothetical protein
VYFFSKEDNGDIHDLSVSVQGRNLFCYLNLLVYVHFMDSTSNASVSISSYNRLCEYCYFDVICSFE